jgi:hypothetical protein
MLNWFQYLFFLPRVILFVAFVLITHYSNIPYASHCFSSGGFFFTLLLVKLGDKFGDIVNFDLLFSKLGIPEVVNTGGAFGK